ncbi:DNA helicase UvrD [Candidatus Uhrbacteria bacterium]|nr:DNA helicase UvrD [Candidatus Uhrbacteria bacterium]
MSKFVADLHVHSKYARACSPALTLENIDAWCRIKGVDIVSTGDFTHPKWFAEIKTKLVPSGHEGLYVLRDGLIPTVPPPILLPKKSTLFMVGTELACIYSQGAPAQGGSARKVRRVHHCIYAPTLEVAAKINAKLAARGCKLGSDGRPILGLSSKNLLELLLEIDKRNVLIPAHAWTPWFAIFGSKSGFDSIAECFEEMSKYIFAIETGLSSDPPMNWRVRELDQVALVSSSDAHSLPNLGREANVFEGEEKDLSYDAIMKAIKNASPARLRARGQGLGSSSEGKNYTLAPNPYPLKMLGTIEFIPDEGRYHFDGHRACKIRLHPRETKKLHNLCPKCKKEMTIGVLSRVEELANESPGRKPEAALKYWSLVELDKIIAETLGIRGRSARAVDKLYWALVEKAGTELNVLLNYSLEELSKITEPRVVEAIARVRDGRVAVSPGYDGEYGVVQIFSAEEKKEAGQRPLF